MVLFQHDHHQVTYDRRVQNKKMFAVTSRPEFHKQWLVIASDNIHFQTNVSCLFTAVPKYDICSQAKKIVQTLEEKQCKEALLLNQRLKLAEHAVNLAERISSMPALELHKSLTAVVAETDLPLHLKAKLILRGCQEHMQSDLKEFLFLWRPWGDAAGEGGFEGDDNTNFNPLKPRLRSLINVISDQEIKLTMMDESDGEEESKAKLAQEIEIARSWKDTQVGVLPSVSGICPVIFLSMQF